MPAEGFALISAFLFAASHVVSKQGVRTTSVVAGLLVSLSTGFTVLGLIVLLNPPDGVTAGAVLLVAASGLLAPGLARASAIAGVDRLGPATSVPIQSSIYPLFAVLGASVVLQEAAGIARWAGVGAIVVGVWLLSRVTADDEVVAVTAERKGTRPRVRTGLVFPVLAGLGYGGADLVRKGAIVHLPHPAFTSTVAVGTALLVWSAATAASPALRRTLRFGPTTYWFVLGGALSSLALLSQFRALETGDISSISPIVASQPLAVLLLSWIFLRGAERLTMSIVFGAVAIVAGTILVSA